MSNPDFFNTDKQCYPSSAIQVAYNDDIVLLLPKACLPLILVDNVYFKRYVHGRNPRVRIPDRRFLMDKIISGFIIRCEGKKILPTLRSYSSVCITFDLWMGRGCEEKFDLIAYGMDTNFKSNKIHLRMIECNSSIGVYLANVLRRELQQKLTSDKFVSCALINDVDANLKTFTNALEGIVRCNPLGPEECFDGTCFCTYPLQFIQCRACYICGR